jgi:hypothetical protein
MTQDEILEIAKEVYGETVWTEASLARLQQFVNLVAAKEREACAKVCDSFQARDVGMQPAECAGAIRARGEQA